MKVLLFGSTGLLGKRLYKILEENNFSILAPTREDVDLQDHHLLENYLKSLNFDILINAAACTNTDYCEDHKEECLKVNWLSPLIMSKIAKDKGAIFIHYSTDYVFDGSKDEYFEEDAKSPLSVYGLSKSYAEDSIIKEGGSYYIIRTSLLYDEGGKNFLSIIPEKILSNEEIICTYDLKSAPTFVPYLAEATIKLLNSNAPFGIYHISGGYPATPCEFIRIYEEVMGKNANVKEVSAAQLNRRAKRPKNSFLNSFKFTTLVGFKPYPIEHYARRIYERLYKKQDRSS